MIDPVDSIMPHSLQYVFSPNDLLALNEAFLQLASDFDESVGDQDDARKHLAIFLFALASDLILRKQPILFEILWCESMRHFDDLFLQNWSA